MNQDINRTVLADYAGFLRVQFAQHVEAREKLSRELNRIDADFDRVKRCLVHTEATLHIIWPQWQSYLAGEAVTP